MNKKEITKQLKDYPAALTVKEAAEILRVSTKLVYRLIKENKVPATKIGREMRIAKCHLASYLLAREQQNLNPKCVVSDKTPDKSWTSDGYDGMCVIAKTVDSHGNQRLLMRNLKGWITCPSPKPRLTRS